MSQSTILKVTTGLVILGAILTPVAIYAKNYFCLSIDTDENVINTENTFVMIDSHESNLCTDCNTQCDSKVPSSEVDEIDEEEGETIYERKDC